MARVFINSILSIALLVACTLLSWHLLSKANFFFGHVYEYNEVEDHINEYAPKNRNRDNFDVTTKEERVRIFGEMVRAINNDGVGLSDIYYRTRSGEEIDKFLTEPELNHLVDVSNLVSYGNTIGVTITSFLVFIYASLYIYKIKNRKPYWTPISVSISFINMVVITFIVTLGIFLIGPHEVFIALHEVLFANKAQWDFFFEESLMTTLLPVPVFGSIVVMLFAVALGWWIFFSLLIGKLLK